MLSFAHWINLLYFLLLPLLFFFTLFGFVFFCFFFLCVHACVYIPLFLWVLCLILYLPFVWDLHFVSCFSVFVLIPVNAGTNHLWYLTSLARDQAQSLWSGSADKTLDFHKTPNPREYLLVRTPIKASTCIHLASLNYQQHPV